MSEKTYGFLKKEDELFPPIVHVETTNICNLRCIHCPHYDIYNIVPEYQPQSIKMDLWKRIVDEVCEYPSALRLTPDGEPMLHKDFIEQVSYAQDKGIETFTFNTNGMLLEGERAEVLLRPGEMRLSVEVSLDGFYQDTYESIRLKGNFRRIMRNVMDFALQRDKLERNNVKLMVSIVQQPEVPDGELEVFNRFWSQIADKVIIRNYVDTKGLTPKKTVDERIVQRRWPCPVVFTRLVVTYDGTVRFCPDDWKKTTVVGKLEKGTSLKEIWQSKELREIRQNHLAETFTHPTCATCTDWKVIRWGSDYSTALKEVFTKTNEEQDEQDNLKYLWNADRDGGVKVVESENKDV